MATLDTNSQICQAWERSPVGLGETPNIILLLWGISYWNDSFFVSLGERSLSEAAHVLQRQLHPPSHTSSHATPSACALTLSASAIYHPELKIQGLVLIILLPWWPGWLSCPSAHGRMLKPFLQCKPGELFSVFLLPTQSHLCAGAADAAQCSFLLNIRFLGRTLVRIWMDKLSCIDTGNPKHS